MELPLTDIECVGVLLSWQDSNFTAKIGGSVLVILPGEMLLWLAYGEQEVIVSDNARRFLAVVASIRAKSPC